MRVQRIVATINVEQLLYRDATRSTFWITNTDNLNSIELQSGPSPGDTLDFWPVPAGQTFVLDPATPLFARAIQDDWWIHSPSGANVVCKMMQG